MRVGPHPHARRSGARGLAILATAAGAHYCAWGPTPTRVAPALADSLSSRRPRALDVALRTWSVSSRTGGVSSAPASSVPHLGASVPHLRASVPHLRASVPHLRTSVPHRGASVPHLPRS